MILGPVSYLDCLVFCVLLAPQLIWHVGLFPTTFCVLKALPFLREMYVRSVLDLMLTPSSLPSAVTLRKGQILEATTGSASFHPTSASIRGPRHTMCPLRFCQHRPKHRACLLLEASRPTILQIPDA